MIFWEIIILKERNPVRDLLLRANLMQWVLPEYQKNLKTELSSNLITSNEYNSELKLKE